MFKKTALITILLMLAGIPKAEAYKTEPLIDDKQKISWKGVVIHHSDSDWGDVNDVHEWHKKRIYIDEFGRERSWRGVGYHYVITREGEIQPGRSLGTEGAHAKGKNKTHIGICLIGKEDYAPAQLYSLGRLMTLLLLTNHNIETIERHHEQCPGPNLQIPSLR